MNMSIESLDDIVVVTIGGIVDSLSAGPLYDALVAQVSAGAQKIVVEFTDTVVLNRAGIRGLIVASKILRNRRGQMRICGAQPQEEQFLNSVSFRHLLTFDRDRAASIVAMAESGEASVDGNHVPTSAKARGTVTSRVWAQPYGVDVPRPVTLFANTGRPSPAANGSHAPE